MVFNSIVFFLTLIPFLGFYYTRRNRRSTLTKLGVLLYSYFFYGMWNPAFLLLIIGSTLVDYFAARLIVVRPGHRKLWLLLSLTTNLGLLGFFKYFNFFAHSFAWMAATFGFEISAGFLDILLPVGISFYTFQTLSYTIDVYRGQLDPRESLLDVAVFVAFFPQLVAGPIVRASDFFPQLETETPIRTDAVADGIFLVLWGLFLKVVIADNVAYRADALFDNWQANGIAGSWTAAMLFGVQIYCDFAGYSLIAIGLARMMGFEIPQNFNAPYAAAGLSDFWTRWHISLSSWLRDYLYIPLGGNRKGKGRTHVNLMTTMVLGGLWHGASVMFVIWGAIHGGALIGERLVRGRFRTPVQSPVLRRTFLFTGIVVTYLVVSVTWIPFRARSIEQCLGMMGSLFQGPVGFRMGLVRDLAVIAVVFGAHVYSRRYDFLGHVRRSGRMRFAMATFILVSLYFLRGQGTEFIYFQF